MRHPMPMRWILISAALLPALGCTPDAARWSELEAPKENVVQFTTLSYAVRFAPGAASLSAADARAFQEFAADSIQPGDRVTIAFDRSNQGIPAELAAQRQAALSRLLARTSVKPIFETASAAGGKTRNTAVLLIGRYVVTPPRCPDWTKPDSDDYTNTPSSNFGCATTTNLGLMVANPADLARGGGSGQADAAFIARSVDAYRSGDSSKSLAQSSGGGGGGGGGGGQSSGSGGGN